MAKKTRSRKVMTEDNFDTIKELEGRLQHKDIAKLSGYSLTTIWRVTQSDTFEDFLEVQREKRRLSEMRRLKEEEDKAWDNVAQLQEQPAEELEQPEVVTRDALEHQATRIADSLDRIVNILESIGE